MLKQVAVIVFVCVSLAAQVEAPDRKVDGNVIISERDPKIRIELPGSVQYVGADRWVLYGMADCELHAFVEADEQKNVQRLYWVQFEGYLPSKPDLKHTYDSPRHATMGGMDFYVDTWVRPNDAAIDPGSDREHIEALIKAKAYKMPAGMMYVRFVHLLDDSKRKELMIIHGEDLNYTGYTAADLIEGGKAHARWPAIAESLVSRAENAIMIDDPSHPRPRG
ncbi:MAG: hypothetical protein WCA13_15040 [Terriglobales bacterium]